MLRAFEFLVAGQIVKTSLLAGVSLGALALAGGAQAADMGARPVYKAPVAAPVWNWTGFYIGANVGVASARSTIADDPNTVWLGTPVSSNKASLIGGIQAGYNWQLASLVLGVEGDISFTSLNRSVTGVGRVFPPETFNARLSTLGTVRGRIGWAFDRILIYGTGGAAFASLKDNLADVVFPFTASPSSTVTGWTGGGGVEFAITDHWTVRAEYLHVGFPNRTAAASPVPPAPYAFAFKDSLDIGRVGINYKF